MADRSVRLFEIIHHFSVMHGEYAVIHFRDKTSLSFLFQQAFEPTVNGKEYSHADRFYKSVRGFVCVGRKCEFTFKDGTKLAADFGDLHQVPLPQEPP